MFPEIKEALKSLDLIIFLPITKEHPIIGSDPEDEVCRKTVDALLKKIYREDLFDFFPSHDRPQHIEIWGNPREKIRA